MQFYILKLFKKQLKAVGEVFAKYGYADSSIVELNDRALSIGVAKAMIEYGKSINAPTSLNELEGFGEKHIQRALNAAKDPQLKMKLQNMPVPMTVEDVDKFMEPVLRGCFNRRFRFSY